VAITLPISEQLDRLTNVDTSGYPVISLYLNLQPDDRGRDRFDTFLRTTLPERIATYAAEGPERGSLERDAEQIRTYLAHVDPSANGLAIFACSGAGLFEAIPMAAPIAAHQLAIADQPHLYPLVRTLDDYPRYAVVVADTHLARLFVVAANAIEQANAIEGEKTKRHKAGGWSQQRYQRHVDNFRAQHAKEIADVLTRIVRDEQIPSIVIGGDAVITSLLNDELPKDIAERIVDTVRLDIHAPVHEILKTSLDIIRKQDGESDRDRVNALLDAYRSGGLGTVGVDAVRQALELGQVSELIIAATKATDATTSEQPHDASGAADGAEQIADELIVKARQTSASIRFIQDPSLLESFGGVGAFLRFKL
jgi:peptide chain release factor subunit 1